MPDPVVSIIVVSWNTADLLAACLSSIAAHVRTRCEVLVVDNASSDDSVARVRREHPEVRVMPQVANLGFARANNVAIAGARGHWVLLLNPDTLVREGSVESLVAFLERTPAAGICGPPLWNRDGSHQHSVQPLPSLRSEFLRQTMLQRVLPDRSAHGSRRHDTRRVDAVTGAALMIRRECLEDVGPLDENIFMFYEDVDWCRRAAAKGWEVWYVDGPGIVHLKGAASGGAVRTRTLLDSQRGTVHFFRKHRGEGSILALRGIALLGAVARTGRALLLWVLRRDPADQRARMRAYVRMALWAVRGGEVPG